MLKESGFLALMRPLRIPKLGKFIICHFENRFLWFRFPEYVCHCYLLISCGSGIRTRIAFVSASVSLAPLCSRGLGVSRCDSALLQSVCQFRHAASPWTFTKVFVYLRC